MTVILPKPKLINKSIWLLDMSENDIPILFQCDVNSFNSMNLWPYWCRHRCQRYVSENNIQLNYHVNIRCHKKLRWFFNDLERNICVGEG